MKKKVCFLMLTLIAAITSLSLTSCGSDDEPQVKSNYYFKLSSVDTNCLDANGESIAPTVKNDWITANKADAQGKISLGKMTRENAEKAFDANVNSLRTQANDFYVGKLPQDGYIDYNFSLVVQSSAVNGTEKSATIRVTNSGVSVY